MSIKILFSVFLIFGHIVNAYSQRDGYLFDNQSDNVEISTLTPTKVNVVCSNENIYKIRIVPDEGIGKVHMRIIAPRANIVLYDNAKDGYKLQKILNMQNSLVIMLELSIVETEDDLENDDFISQGWAAMLIQSKLK
ncbi:MAG: hypothetical protein KAI79_13415 [Bacteroidales bacterium]|nr:hypothetical protein [Bacteroidales bacterium]